MTTNIRPRGPNAHARKTKRWYFTDRRLAALPLPDRTLAEYDARRPSLGLRRLGSGKKIFFWARNVNARGIWKHLGEHPTTTVEVARGRAEELDEQLKDYARRGFTGQNPFAEPDVPSVLTLQALVEKYVSDYVTLHWKNKDEGAKALRAMLANYLGDWRDRDVTTITRAQVLSRHAKIWREHGGVIANRVAAALRSAIKWAIDSELLAVAKNPASLRAKELFKETPRTRYLGEKGKSDEPRRFLAECAKLKNADLRDYLQLLLRCGQRATVTMRMRWASVDLQRRTWTLEPHETKNKKQHVCQLSQQAAHILAARKAVATTPWVFPGKNRKGPRHGFFDGAWKQLLEAAGLEDFHLHDLRHTYCSLAVASGESLPKVQAAVGHASLRSTERYVHVSREAEAATVEAMERELERQVASVDAGARPERVN